MRTKKESNIQHGEQIKLARESAGLTQEQFAELIDRTPQFISDLERGVTGISLDTLKIICTKLHITSDSILFPNRVAGDTDELTAKIQLMTEPQRKAAAQIINAFLYAVDAAK